MSLGCKQSIRNCLGPLLRYSVDNLDTNEWIHVELNQLLSISTHVEEAAMRNILPLTSVMKLDMGNICSLRNTSFIYQDSKIWYVLSKLHTHCKMILIIRHIKYLFVITPSSYLTSIRFNKCNIMRALYILLITVHSM